MGAPIQVYPLYENGFRAHRGQTSSENNSESAQLYANFSQVAAKHPFAWNYGKPPLGIDAIGNASKANRMICYPCMPSLFVLNLHWLTKVDPLLMNAFNMVNMAAACVLTSTDVARKLGIPESKWIYALGGAGTKESDVCKTAPSVYVFLPANEILSSLGTSQLLFKSCYFPFYRCGIERFRYQGRRC